MVPAIAPVDSVAWDPVLGGGLVGDTLVGATVEDMQQQGYNSNSSTDTLTCTDAR